MSTNATQSASKPEQSRSVRLPGEDLSLNEMLRVMDVAREMRRNRDVAEEMFRRDEVRVELREKLMRSAQLAGDRVTEAEVDAAIDQYFSSLNAYSDPKPGFKSAVAHAWVWRKRILAGVASVVIACGGIYYLFFSAAAPLSPSVRADQAIAAEQETASALVERISAMTTDANVVAEAKSLQAEINASRAEDVTAAIAAREKLAGMVDQLAQTYEVHIANANDPSQPSAIERGRGELDSNYYVIVEARDAAGRPMVQSIRNAETDRVEKVTRWAEEVPQEVFQRLKQDKSRDGLLGETLFSVKNRGEMQPQIQLKSVAGVPIVQGNRLTNFK